MILVKQESSLPSLPLKVTTMTQDDLEKAINRTKEEIYRMKQQ